MSVIGEELLTFNFEFLAALVFNVFKIKQTRCSRQFFISHRVVIRESSHIIRKNSREKFLKYEQNIFCSLVNLNRLFLKGWIQLAVNKPSRKLKAVPVNIEHTINSILNLSPIKSRLVFYSWIHNTPLRAVKFKFTLHGNLSIDCWRLHVSCVWNI